MYKRLLLAALIAGSSFSIPTLGVTGVAAAPMPACADHLPPGMKRPGGYCDLRQSNDTLAPPVATIKVEEAAAPPPGGGGGGCTSIDLRKLFLRLPIGARVHTAC
jgi:hypothetical protein